LELAADVGGKSHGFRFIQLPFNLAMAEAITLSNQIVDGRSVSNRRKRLPALGVTVMSSASIFQGRVAQGLPQELRESLGSLPSDAQTAIQFVRSAPGICTALIGMSRIEHVDENLKLVNVEPLEPDQFMPTVLKYLIFGVR
jgi:aryl-alcohol dehydrogenase-like predicted oxidoreductase